MTMTLAPNTAKLRQKHADTVAPGLDRAKPISIRAGEVDQLDYFLYVPESVRADSPVVAAIHGLRRSAAQQIFQLKDLAEAHGMILFAPLFARDQFRHFQSLAVNEAGSYPEDAFDVALADCLQRLDLANPGLFLLGFSGGAQFAHRYVMMGSRTVRKIALMAPGWFTMPDPEQPFPFGLGPSDHLGDRKVDLTGALECPTMLLVGKGDTKRTSSLNQDPIIDAHQGLNRLERGENWIAAMQARQSGTAIEDLQLIKGGGHNFEKMIHRRGMGEHIFNWFAS